MAGLELVDETDPTVPEKKAVAPVAEPRPAPVERKYVEPKGLNDVNQYGPYAGVVNREPPEQGRLGSAGGHIVRGFGEMVASVPQALAETAALLGEKTGVSELPEGASVTEHPFYKAGDRINKFFEAPINPKYQHEFNQKLAHGAGTLLGFAAGGMAGKAAKLPAWLVPATFGAAAEGTALAQDYAAVQAAKGLAVDPAERSKAFMWGSVVGTSEAMPISRLINRIDHATGGAAQKALKDSGKWAMAKEIGKEAFKGGIEEMSQEVFQSVAGNYVANGIMKYDKERNLYEGTVEGGEIGFTLGFLFNALGAAVGTRRMRLKKLGLDDAPPVDDEGPSGPPKALTHEPNDPMIQMPDGSLATRKQVEEDIAAWEQVANEAEPNSPERSQAAEEAMNLRAQLEGMPGGTKEAQAKFKRPKGIIKKNLTNVFDEADGAKDDAGLEAAAAKADKIATAATSKKEARDATEAAALFRDAKVGTEQEPEVTPPGRDEETSAPEPKGEDTTTPEPEPTGFEPTHELPDGTRVVANIEEGVIKPDEWVDEKGDIIEDQNAEPLKQDAKEGATVTDVPTDETTTEPEPEATTEPEQEVETPPEPTPEPEPATEPEPEPTATPEPEAAPETAVEPEPKDEGGLDIDGMMDDAEAEIDAEANEAATSEENDKPQPTEQEKEDGDYEKGEISPELVNGHKISIENPKGSERSGQDQEGKPWTQKMANHYGYFKRSEGFDGDEVDVFLGPKASDPRADIFVVNQVDPKTGNFDEHKVMMGFDSQQEATDAYQANYQKGWKGMDSIDTYTQEDFKKKLDSGFFKNSTIEHQGKKAPKYTPEQEAEMAAPPGEERVVKEVKEYRYFENQAVEKDVKQNPKSREIMVEMTPQEFLDVAAEGVDQIKTDTVNKIIAEGKEFNTVPTLKFENAGNGVAQVFGHEGRHRARKLIELGINKMPVVLTSVESDRGPAIRWGSQEVGSNDRIDPKDFPTQLLGQENTKKSIPFPVKAAEVGLQGQGLEQTTEPGGKVPTYQEYFDERVKGSNPPRKASDKAYVVTGFNGEPNIWDTEPSKSGLVGKQMTLGEAVKKRYEWWLKQNNLTEPAAEETKPTGKGKPLSEITLSHEVTVEETGETVIIEQNAEVAMRQIDKRMSAIQSLKECLA